MPTSIVDRFKAKFGFVSADLYAIRRGKTAEALAGAERALAHLTRVEGEVLDYAKKIKALQEKLKVADQAVLASRTSEAYAYLDQAKASARELEQEMTLAAKKSPTTCALADGTNAKIYPPDIPGFLEMDPVFRDEMLSVVAEKIDSGKRLMALLRSDDAADIDEISTSREAVADVLWFLKTTAEAKAGQPYERGALTLPDPDGKLASFFDRCEKVYTRDSSHLKSNQAEEGGQARGIDFYDGVHEGRIGDPSMLLPAGMRTVLAQALEIDGKKRLYVKMETESARWNPFHSKQDGAPASRPLEAGDRKNAMLHLLNLVKSKIGMSQGDDHSLANFREKVPGGVKSAYAALQSAAARSSKAKAFLKGAKEVNEMVVALDQVYGLEEGEIPLAFPDAAEAFFQTLLRALPKNTSQEIEDLYNGVGGEIVLNDRDLPPRPASAPPAAS